MRGHEAIIRMRTGLGKKPVFVFINDYPCETDWFDAGGKFARVSVHNDDVTQLDLRFLMGLSVSITASTEARAKALFDLAKQAGAVTVASCHVKYGVHEFQQDGWAQAWRKEVAHG